MSETIRIIPAEGVLEFDHVTTGLANRIRLKAEETGSYSIKLVSGITNPGTGSALFVGNKIVGEIRETGQWAINSAVDDTAALHVKGLDDSADYAFKAVNSSDGKLFDVENSGNINSNTHLPYLDSAYTLGSPSLKWLNIHTANITADTTTIGGNTVDSTKIDNWNTAYSWGNHALFGYITCTTLVSCTEFQNVTSSITALDSRLTTAEGNITDLDSRLTTAEGNITAIDSRLTTAEGNITAIDSRLTTAEGNITALDSRLTTAEISIVDYGIRLDDLETFTPGSVLFTGSNGHLTEDNPNFFWDDVNNRLGIGKNSSLQATLDIKGSGSSNTTKAFIVSNSANIESVSVSNNGILGIGAPVYPAGGTLPSLLIKSRGSSAAAVNVRDTTDSFDSIILRSEGLSGFEFRSSSSNSIAMQYIARFNGLTVWTTYTNNAPLAIGYSNSMNNGIAGLTISANDQTGTGIINAVLKIAEVYVNFTPGNDNADFHFFGQKGTINQNLAYVKPVFGYSLNHTVTSAGLYQGFALKSNITNATKIIGFHHNPNISGTVTNNYAFIASSGNSGFGIDSPTRLVHIKGTSDTANTFSFRVENASNTAYFEVSNGGRAEASSFYSNNFFSPNYVNIGYAGGTTAIWVNGNTGNTLVGFKSGYEPNAALHIVGKGTSSVTNALLISNSSFTDMLQMTDSGRIGIGIGAVTLTAKVNIVGEGNTVSTIPLQVRNTSGNLSFSVYDDVSAAIGGKTLAPNALDINISKNTDVGVIVQNNNSGTIAGASLSAITSTTNKQVFIQMLGDNWTVAQFDGRNVGGWARIGGSSGVAGMQFINSGSGPIVLYNTNKEVMSFTGDVIKMGRNTGYTTFAPSTGSSSLYHFYIMDSFTPSGTTTSPFSSVFIDTYILPSITGSISNAINILPTLNYASDASGTYRGIYYNPTLTNAPLNHYAAIFASGKIGVGTTTPTAKLQIRGDGTSASTQPFSVLNSSGSNVFTLYDSVQAVFGLTTTTQTTVDVRLDQNTRTGLHVQNASTGTGAFAAIMTLGPVGNNSSMGIFTFGPGYVGTTDGRSFQNWGVLSTSSGNAGLTIRNNSSTGPLVLFNVDKEVVSFTGDYMKIGRNSGITTFAPTAGVAATFQHVHIVDAFTPGVAASSNSFRSLQIDTTITPLGSGTSATALYINPTLDFTNSTSGTYRGIYYNPTITFAPANHYAAVFGSGNIGIGTVTPTQLVEVVQNSAALSYGLYPSINLRNDNANGYAQYALTTGANVTDMVSRWIFDPTRNVTFGSYVNGKSLIFITNNTSRMAIRGDGGSTAGFVGIGTTTPGWRLEVLSASTSESIMLVRRSDTSRMLEIREVASPSNAYIEMFGLGNAGIVGIGVTNGTYRLQVQASASNVNIFSVARNNGDKLIEATDTGGNRHLGFFGVTPVVRPTGGAATAGGTYTAAEQTMLQAVYDAVRNLGLMT